MPLSHYFNGQGDRVKRALKRRYGAEKGTRIFYALLAKKKRK